MKKLILLQLFRRTHYVLLALILFSACTKSATEQNNQNGNDNPNTTPQYKFSAPQRIIEMPDVYFEQRAFITQNKIYMRLSSDLSSMTFSRGSYSMFFDFPEPYSTNRRTVTPATGPFCVDKGEQFLYVEDNYSIYKCSLSNTASVTKISTVGVAGGKLLNIADNGDLYLATTLNGGALMKIRNGTSTPEIVAQNLGTAPVALAFFENDIYVTLDNLNGSVRKISASGTVSTVLDNLTKPSRLVFDNNGNMILETKTTIDGADYGIYTIYTKSGTKIMDITDDKDTLILSAFGAEGMVALFVDTNNNLYFGQSDYISTSYINHCNPHIEDGSYGNRTSNIYKIGLIKQ